MIEVLKSFFTLGSYHYSDFDNSLHAAISRLDYRSQ